MRGAMGAADARQAGWDQLAGGIGGAAEAWHAGRQQPSISAVPTAAERRMWSARPELARMPAPNYLSWGVR
jgi:hypothetical protein